MRLRNIRGSKETIAASDYVVQEPETYKGTWGQLFGNEQPVQIEVGMEKVRKIKQDSMSKSKTAGRRLFITGAEVKKEAAFLIGSSHRLMRKGSLIFLLEASFRTPDCRLYMKESICAGERA